MLHCRQTGLTGMAKGVSGPPMSGLHQSRKRRAYAVILRIDIFGGKPAFVKHHFFYGYEHRLCAVWFGG